MTDDVRLLRKVLILDHSVECFDRIKAFCEENGLVGLKSQSKNVLSVLGSNVDLGAILLAENYMGTIDETIKLARLIRAARPELPIALRRSSAQNAAEIPLTFAKLFFVIYGIDDMAPLKNAVDEYLFSMYYPTVLVRGISEISLNALAAQFRHLQVAAEPPYVVRDRIIYGEVFSLIEIESSWCRGYMMLQIEEHAVLNVLDHKDILNQSSQSFKSVNNLLGETTNLIWGAFKNRFIADDDLGSMSTTQVPIVVNHQHKYISFGSDLPQLCFKYTLSDDLGQFVTIYQWFIFNLRWSPEDFKEIQVAVEQMVDSGELELF
jgi:Chemotaxis phosphatase CheX